VRVVLLIVSLSAIVSACSNIKVLDKEACADLGVVGAHCAHLYTTNRRDIEKPAWDKERVGWVCMRGDDFSDNMDEIDKLCRNTKLCDYATKKKIEKVKQNMTPLLSGAKTAKVQATK
jgi:hypothetical protein